MRLKSLCLSALVSGLSAVPALAQDGPASPERYYGPGRMMGYWGGPLNSYGFFLHPIFMLLALAGLVAIVAWLVHMLGRGAGRERFGHRGSAALDILEERFARGEIDKAEFEERRRLIRG